MGHRILEPQANTLPTFCLVGQGTADGVKMTTAKPGAVRYGTITGRRPAEFFLAAESDIGDSWNCTPKF